MDMANKARKFLLMAIAAGASIAMAACPGTNRHDVPDDPVFRIELEGVQVGGEHTFPEQFYGYVANAVTPLSVTVRNDGNRATGPLTVTLSGDDYDSFWLARPSATQSLELALGDLGVDEEAVFTVTPRHDLAVGTYTATVTVSGGNAITESFSVRFVVLPVGDDPVYGIELEGVEEEHTFDELYYGYAENAITALPVTVRNTGNRATGPLTVTLTGDDADSFGLSTSSASLSSTLALDSLGIGEPTTFTVRPRHDLAVRTHTATVTVSGGSAITARSFDVTFEVIPAEVPVYRIELAGGLQGEYHAFPELYFGYAADEITVLTIMVENTGNRVTGPLTVTLSGDDYDSFGLSIPPAAQSLELALSSIDVGESAIFTVRPRDDLALGTHTATVTVSGGSESAITAQSFDVAFEVIPRPMHDIRLSATNTFQIRLLDYAASEIEPLVVTVNSVGTHPTGELAVALSGTNMGAFTLSATTLSSIPSGENATFNVLPAHGLGLGVYTATVTVSGADVDSRYFDLTFEVVADMDITADFVHAGFLNRVRTLTGIATPNPIYLSDVMSRTAWTLPNASGAADFVDNFAGLQHFRSLEILNISHHGAVAASPHTPADGRGGIDISVLPNLREFHSNGAVQTQATMRLRWIIVGNPMLERVEINTPNASFTSLDLTSAPSLRRLVLTSAPNVDTLDLSQNPLLEVLYLVGSNNLRVVDASGNPNLTRLDISGGGVGRNLELNLANNANLEWVRINSAGLTSFDWPTLSSLRELNLSGNNLTLVNLRLLQALELVRVEQNNLTSLDLSDTPNLREVNAELNAISEVVLRNNMGLTTLNLANNGAGRTGTEVGTFSDTNFAGIDFAQAPTLEFLNLERNSLTGLNLANLGNILQL